MKPEPVRFGRYILDARLARGGMAEVYKASYVAAAGVTKRLVIKKILPHMAGDKNFISMFIAEAKLSATFAHGNVVQVFDFGEVNGEYFIAMEYVEGTSLGRLLKRAEEKGFQVLPAPYAVSIVMEACKGLQYAHTRQDENGEPFNVVHRDVTPENILLSYEGQVKVADFGVAKARVEGRRDTEPGMVKGKVLYLSPEQARGEPLDARTDVFALGVVLFRMLCGRLPFSGDEGRVMTKIARGEVPRPSEFNPQIDFELERIVMQAMAPEREDRTASANTLLHQLSKWMNINAPAHPPDAAAHLVAYLCDAELTVLRGRPPVVPEAFREELTAFRNLQQQRAPSADSRATKEMRTPLASSAMDPSDTAKDDGTTASGAEAPPGRTRALAMLGAGFAAAIVAASVMWAGFAQRGPKTFDVVIRTIPPSAVVAVDSEFWPERTPLTLQLPADRAHDVRLSLPGHLEWSGSVEAKPGEVRTLAVSLEPDEGWKKPLAAAAAADEGAKQAELDKIDADRAPASGVLWRRPNAVSFSRERPSFNAHAGDNHMFEVLGEGPVKTNLVSPRGAARAAGEALFYAETVLVMEETPLAGALKVHAVQPGAPLHLMLSEDDSVRIVRLFDDSMMPAEGDSLRVRVRSGGKAIVLDSLSRLSVTPEQRFRVRHLDAESSYELQLKAEGGGPAAVLCTFISKSGRPRLDGQVRTSQQVFLLPHTLSFVNVDSLWCSTLDLGSAGAPKVTIDVRQQ